MDNKVYYPDVFLVNSKDDPKLKVVAGMDEDGKLKTVPPSKQHEQNFMKFDKRSNILENFIANFLRQYKNPTHFNFFKVSAENVESNAMVIGEMLKDPDTPSNKEMLEELTVILFVSILLMYFILAAQFESFVQPLIVLMEIPIDVAFALLLLWVCGHTLNLMSAIGLIVTCGIIINDSILKLDAINELRKEGVPLMEAIHEAGRRRLRPIIMTSLTTMPAYLSE